VSPLPPPISAHRLIGDGRGAALVLPTGEIDWWCAPRFDSPPRLWSLLDPDGARARFVGVRPVDRRDEPAGPTALTCVRADCGLVEVWDALVEDRLVRLVRCLDGPLDIVHRANLGGFDGPWLWPGGDTVLTAPAGEWAALVVSAAGVATTANGEAEARAVRFRALERGAEIPRPWLPGRHQDRAGQALAVLRACTYEGTGAMVASPVTSLPEAPGHDRQFDYRYAWLRDSSLAASVAALVGRHEMAETHLRFLCHLGDRVFESPLVDVTGGTVPQEREVAGVTGWAGSRPVRVGNAARNQIQYDALGFVVEAVSTHLQHGGRLNRETWRLIRAIADRVCVRREEETNGIWELRKPRDLVCAEIGRWIALDRALWIARGWRPWTRRRHWRAARARCRDRVLAELRDDGRLPQVYGGDPDTVDASGLLVVIFRMLDRRDLRAGRLVDAHLRLLGAGPFTYRYEPGLDDGFAGVEGAFVPCSWWAVSALASVGRLAEAEERAEALCAVLPPLLPEEMDPATGQALGNTPLVWSHMEMARALHLLDAAAVRRRFGFAGVVVWRAARHIRRRVWRRGALRGRAGTRLKATLGAKRWG
jgi:GH15 family glucan-1,4-alpha-glucosidase